MPSSSEPRRVPVLIAGGGPVGLTLAALLARRGVACRVIEADAGYCSGSRAICISRRSQEIFGWFDGDAALAAIGLPWTGGRSYFRAAEVLHFRMPSEPTERHAPMLNIQQYHVEEIAHRAAVAGGAEVCWQSRVTGLAQHPSHAVATVEHADGRVEAIEADWVVACDGGRSTLREACGLALEGMQYEGRYVIVDIEQESARPVERLAWFDPPSNPGSTLLMHRQPGNVWRIDYQIPDDADPAAAIDPDQVLPRVASHLRMIGEDAPWKPLWISLYNAKCLTLADYRHGRVLFAGDAAHLVPIFGVRGLNSGLDDAANLAWKLASVIAGSATPTLLDSYSAERVHATRQNLAYGAKSTEFMAPPHAGFSLMRDAALRLALENPAVRTLINPRQSTPISYPASPLNATPADSDAAAQPGDPAPEALLADGHLTRRFGGSFVALLFSDRAGAELAIAVPPGSGVAALSVLRIARTPPLPEDATASHDLHGEAWQRYGASEGLLVLVRPDGYLMGRWATTDNAALSAALASSRGAADPACRVPTPWETR